MENIMQIEADRLISGLILDPSGYDDWQTVKAVHPYVDAYGNAYDVEFYNGQRFKYRDGDEIYYRLA